jgi:CRP-like cAMP-binding protein
MISRGGQHPYLQSLIDLRRDDPELEQALISRSYRAGQTITEVGVLSSGLCMVVKGRIQLLHVGPRDWRIVLATLGPGNVFGDGFLKATPDPQLMAVALTDCVLWVLPSVAAHAFMQRYPVLAWSMLFTVGERLAQVEDRIEGVAYRRLPSQLAGLLLELEDGHAIVHGYSHQTLAYMLGTYRETISTVLRRFKDAGLVRLGYRRIELSDLASLQTLAESGA